MNRFRENLCRFAGAAAVLLVVGAFATVPGAAEGALDWPDSGALQVDGERVEVFGDGAVMERMALRGTDLNVRMRILPDWDVLREPPSRYSVVIRHRFRPEMFLGIGRFSPDRFLPDLSDGSWEAYRQGLAERYGESLEILEEPHRTGIGRGVAILGETNRSILYRIRGGEGDVLRLEIFLIHRDRLLAFRLHGPEDLVRANRSTIEFLLGRMAWVRNP